MKQGFLNNEMSSTFYKPCSVPLYCKWESPSYSGDNHLSPRNLGPLFRSFPLRRFPYHYLGFSLVGFTAFHLCCFQQSFVTVALSKVLGHIQKDVDVFLAIHAKSTTLAYCFTKHEHYGHLRPCEHGLSSASSDTAIVQTLRIAILYYTLLYIYFKYLILKVYFQIHVFQD